MKRLFLLALAGGVLFLPACGSGPNPVVVIETSMGDIKAELYQDKAPITVKNFLEYVDAKHYDGTIFEHARARLGNVHRRTHCPARGENSKDNDIVGKRGRSSFCRAPEIGWQDRDGKNRNGPFWGNGRSATTITNN